MAEVGHATKQSIFDLDFTVHFPSEFNALSITAGVMVLVRVLCHEPMLDNGYQVIKHTRDQTYKNTYVEIYF